VPAKPRWLLHIPGIVAELRALEAPVVDRATFERLFGVRRRRAITLMQSFGGYVSGSAVLLDREALIARLTAMQADPEVDREVRRKQRLSARLDSLRRHRSAAQVLIRVPEDAPSRRLRDLPQGIALGPGRLTIDFEGAEQLLTKLYEFSQAIANDYDQFCAALTPAADQQKGSGPELAA
jgi:hypothetical protein